MSEKTGVAVTEAFLNVDGHLLVHLFEVCSVVRSHVDKSQL